MFVVEDGTGLSTANAYVSTAFVDTYAVDRNAVAWANLTPAVKQAAIIIASDYIDARSAFYGSQKLYTQGLAWPRTGAYDRKANLAVPENLVPQPIQEAAAELAIKSGTSGDPLLADLNPNIESARVANVAVVYRKNQAMEQTWFGILGLIEGLLYPTHDPTFGVMPVLTSETAGMDYFNPDMYDNKLGG